MTVELKAFEFTTRCFGIVLHDGTEYDGKNEKDGSVSYAVLRENFFTGIRHYKCGMVTQTMVSFKDVKLIKPIDQADLEAGTMLDLRTFGLNSVNITEHYDTFTPYLKEHGDDHAMYFKVTQKEPA